MRAAKARRAVVASVFKTNILEAPRSLEGYLCLGINILSNILRHHLNLRLKNFDIWMTFGVNFTTYRSHGRWALGIKYSVPTHVKGIYGCVFTCTVSPSFEVMIGMVDVRSVAPFQASGLVM